MAIDLHIERLVLHRLSLGPTEGERVRQALTRELAMLLERGGLVPELAGGGARPRVAGGEVYWNRQTPAAALGRGLAAAIYQGIGAPAAAAPRGRR